MALWFAGFFLGATVNAYDVSNKDYAGDPPPASHGYGAASLSDLHAPINAHRGDYQHRMTGSPGQVTGMPSARMHATLTAVPGGRLMLFGGTAAIRQRGGSMYLNDLYIFDTTRVRLLSPSWLHVPHAVTQTMPTPTLTFQLVRRFVLVGRME